MLHITVDQARFTLAKWFFTKHTPASIFIRTGEITSGLYADVYCLHQHLLDQNLLDEADELGSILRYLEARKLRLN